MAAGLALLLVAGCGFTPSPSGQEPPAVERFTTADVEEAVEDLAQLGIETREAPSDASPIAPVQGDRSSVRLLRHQVRNLALELTAGGGTRGAELDALSAAGGGFAVSPLLAGWADSAATDAARWAASILQDRRPADSSATVFPTVVLVAFVADASRGGGERSDSPGAVLAINQSQWRSSDAVTGLLTPDNQDFCAEVSAYLSAALDDVVNTHADPPPWLSQLIDLYAPQYASDPEALRRTIGAVALLSYATSLARTWTVNLLPDPLAVAYSIAGQDPIQGDVVLTVSSGQDVFADDVADCASLADAQLASVPIEGSSVIWDSTGLNGHATEVSSFTTLDDIDSAGLTYQTTTESQEDAENGDPVTAQMWVNAWVDRAEMAALAAVVKSILLGEAGGTPAGSTAKALYQAMEPTLNVMMRPSGFAFVDVTYHTPKASPSPGPSRPPAADVSGTWEGTWLNDLEFQGVAASGGFALTLSQTGDQVTGTARFSGPTCVGEVPIQGTVHGSTVELPMPSEWDIRFVGTVDGDAMSGTYSAIACYPAGIIVTGTWQATRD
jgi:hypothetical protein